MAEFVANYGIWVVAAFIALESVGIPLPAEAALIAAGFFAARTHGIDIWTLIGAGIVAAIALAASIFVFAQHHGEETPMAVAPTPAVQPANAVPGTGVAIESAGKSVSVFYLPTANELSTSVVVWVDETGEK
jgi:hypothetical protein